jgi:hypothetical protein
VSQHAGLGLERWRTFDRNRQVLMVANEMFRGSKVHDAEGRRRCYERVLRLADLTAQAAERPTFRREMMRWRGLVAERYLAAAVDDSGHRALLAALLVMTPEAARQRPFVLGQSPGSPSPDGE